MLYMLDKNNGWTLKNITQEKIGTESQIQTRRLSACECILLQIKKCQKKTTLKKAFSTSYFYHFYMYTHGKYRNVVTMIDSSD